MASPDDTVAELAAPDTHALAGIREESLAVLGDLIGADARVALIDVPTHQNVGDTMIWAGEEEYLRRLGASVDYVTDLIRFDEAMLRRRVPTGPILLHGGGNFGDVWPWFQEFREDVVRRFPDRRIVQLPQTVQFASAEAAARSNAALGAHSDFTLLVRDRRSLALAHEVLPDVRTVFCPDAALGWSPTPPTAETTTRMLVLARRDREAGSDLAARLAPLIGPDDIVMDWGFHGLQQARWLLPRIPGRVTKLAPRLRRSDLADRLVVSGYRANVRQNLESAVRRFSRSRLVVTDRLHAHVLAGLLGRQHLVLDNNYGKVGAIYRDYTKLFTTATFVDDPATIADRVRERLEGLR